MTQKTSQSRVRRQGRNKTNDAGQGKNTRSTWLGFVNQPVPRQRENQFWIAGITTCKRATESQAMPSLTT